MSYYPDRLLQTSDLTPFYTSGHANYTGPDPNGLHSNAFYRGSYRGYLSEGPGPTGVATDLSGAAMGPDSTPYDSYIYPTDETVRSASVHMNPSLLQSTYYPNSEGPSCPQTFQSLSGSSGDYTAHSRRASVSPTTPCKKTAPVGVFYRSHIIDDLSCMPGSGDQMLAMESYSGGATHRSTHFGTPGASSGDRLGQTVNEVANIGEGYFDGRRYDQLQPPPPQQQLPSRATEDIPDKEGVPTEGGDSHGFGLHTTTLGVRRPPQAEDHPPADSSSSSSSSTSSSQQQAGQASSSAERNDGGSRTGGGGGIGLGGSHEEVKTEESGEDPNGFRTKRRRIPTELDQPESESSGDSVDGDTPEEDGGRLQETNGLDGAAPMFPWMKLHHGERLSPSCICLCAQLCVTNIMSCIML